MRLSRPHDGEVSEIAEYLRRYCNRELSRIEIDRLVGLAALIARQKLYGRLLAAAKAQDVAVEQQTTSVIAGLFCVEGADTALKTALTGYLEEDDISLFTRFQSVVVNHAWQELFHRWKEHDRADFLLWRNFNRVLSKDARISLFPSDNPQYVSLAGSKELYGDRPPIDHDRLVQIIGSIERVFSSTSDLVYEILLRISEVPDCQNAVKKHILFSALSYAKKVIASAELEKSAVNGRTNPDLKIAVERALETTVKKLKAKLDKYRIDGKLESDVVEKSDRALRDILEDCAESGEPAQSYYDYLTAHWSDLVYEDYRKRYRSRFEYLAEFVRKSFLKDMRDQFID